MMVRKKLAVFLIVLIVGLAAFIYLYSANNKDAEYRGVFVEAYNKEATL